MVGSAGGGKIECRSSRIACWMVESLRENIMSTNLFAAKKNTKVTAEWLQLLNLSLDSVFE